MSLSLDDRQRAMLAEMGVRLFEGMPRAAAAPAQVAQPVADAPMARAPVPAAPQAKGLGGTRPMQNALLARAEHLSRARPVNG